MTSALHTEELTKRYGRNLALTNVSLDIPTGRIAALVGPNGAGKSTLLLIACGLIAPTSGTIKVLGNSPAANTRQLARVGFVAQDRPIYSGLSVADHLRLGARLNPAWDEGLAQRRIKQIDLDPTQKAGQLSAGHRAQLALTIAAAKRSELLILDEPVVALDTLARREFLESLLLVNERHVTVVLSSHLLSDLERVCDYLIVLASSKVQLAGEVDDLLASHKRLVGARNDFGHLPAEIDVVSAEHGRHQSTLIVRRTDTTPIPPLQTAEPIDLEEMVLAYMTRAAGASIDTPQTGP